MEISNFSTSPGTPEGKAMTLVASVETSKRFAAVIADLNNKVALPFDIFVSWSDCDEPDAYYDPETHKLVICHQLIDE